MSSQSVLSDECFAASLTHVTFRTRVDALVSIEIVFALEDTVTVVASKGFHTSDGWALLFDISVFGPSLSGRV